MAGQRIDIMELRSLIIFKLKGFSNRKVADYLKVDRKTVDRYTTRFKSLDLTYQELVELQESDLRDLFTENSQTEKERYETLSNQFAVFQKELQKPGGTLQQLWKEYSLKNPDGYKYTQFALHYRNLDIPTHSAPPIPRQSTPVLFDAELYILAKVSHLFRFKFLIIKNIGFVLLLFFPPFELLRNP